MEVVPPCAALTPAGEWTTPWPVAEHATSADMARCRRRGELMSAVMGAAHAPPPGGAVDTAECGRRIWPAPAKSTCSTCVCSGKAPKGDKSLKGTRDSVSALIGRARM